MRLRNWERYLALTFDNRIIIMQAQAHQEWGGIIALFDGFSPVPYHYKEFKKVLLYTPKNLIKLLRMQKEKL